MMAFKDAAEGIEKEGGKMKATFVGCNCGRIKKNNQYNIEVDYNNKIVCAEGDGFKYSFTYKTIKDLKNDWLFNNGRITDQHWRNLDPWEMCGQDHFCKRGCHEKGGCVNGCIVPQIYSKLAILEDAEDEEMSRLLDDTEVKVER